MSAPEKTPAEISAKSTKIEILEAYQEALKQLQNTSDKNPQQKQEIKEQRETLVRAAKNSEHSIISNLADLKINLTKQIDQLSEQVLCEFNRLSDIQKAIATEQEHLKNLYEIKETAHTLSALLITQEDETKKHKISMQNFHADFELEMAEKRKHWKKELQILEQEYQEFKAELDRKRVREEEEYAYRLEVSRKKEEDEYKTKKSTLEKQLADKKLMIEQGEAELKLRENELVQLRKTVDAIPAEIAKAVEDAKKQVTYELETKFKFETELKGKELEGERKLTEQKIITLEAKIKEQQALIDTLMVKADVATEQVKSIACQALDASSDRFNRSLHKSETKPETLRTAA